MSPVIIKGLMAAGGLGIGGVGAWQIHEHTKPRTLQQRLERDGESFHSMVEGEDISGWKELAKKYSTGTSENTNNRFTSITISSSADATEQDAKALQTECKKLAQKELGGTNQESDMAKLRTWCLKPKATQQS